MHNEGAMVEGVGVAREVYLDNNAATAALAPVARVVADALIEGFGNPSSPHGRGDAAQRRLERARGIVADLLGAEPEQIVFVSGGTEANNAVLALRPSLLITSAVEHASILAPARRLAAEGCRVVVIDVDHAGCVRLGALEEALRARAEAGACLVSIQWTNSETGVVQPVEEIARLCRRHGALFHTDAAQAVGRLPMDLQHLSADFLTFSGHKLHAPPGTGALFVRRPGSFAPFILGGGQEAGLRSGTPNLPGILGLAVAVEERARDLPNAIARLTGLRDAFEAGILAVVPDVVINGASAERVGNTSNLRFAGIDGQALLAALDRAGLRCSQASACSSGRPEPSHVLRAMGLTEGEAYASLRFSFSLLNTMSDVDFAVAAIRDAVARLRALPPL